MRASGFYPTSSTSTTKPEPCAECKRLLKFEKMRDLPLPQRVSYVYQGLINEALEGK